MIPAANDCKIFIREGKKNFFFLRQHKNNGDNAIVVSLSKEKVTKITTF